MLRAEGRGRLKSGDLSPHPLFIEYHFAGIFHILFEFERRRNHGYRMKSNVHQAVSMQNNQFSMGNHNDDVRQFGKLVGTPSIAQPRKSPLTMLMPLELQGRSRILK